MIATRLRVFAAYAAPALQLFDHFDSVALTSSRFRIAIANTQRLLAVDRPRLARVARSVLAAEGVAAAEVSVALVNDAQIHAINRQFLGHDCPTDVISFLLDEPATSHSRRRARPAASLPSSPRRNRRSPAAPPRGAGKSICGEIIISAETARGNASRFGWRPSDELCLYLVHGLLHLCGYDDLSAAERRLMRRREAEMLARFNLSPRYVESRRP